MLKENIRKYLIKKKLTPSALAVKAGVPRYSLLRYIKEENADITLKVAERISLYINMNP